VPPFRASNQLALATKIKAGRYPPLGAPYSTALTQTVWPAARRTRACVCVCVCVCVCPARLTSAYDRWREC
jgi:hypothetical protein